MGTTDSRQRNGGAGILVEDGNNNILCEASYPAGKLCSSFGAESVALIEALEWIKKEPKSAVICTDSLSLHQALQNASWRTRDNGVNRIRKLVTEIACPITLLWYPSHCGIADNERADMLAEVGSRLPQEEVPVSHAIVKAKINNRRWKIQHERAACTFRGRREPRRDIESKWPRSVRILYSRLRTGHAKELKRYIYLIDQEDDASCECGEEEESIEHILCECPILENKRRRIFEGEVGIDMMVTQPEKSRKLLSERFTNLKLNIENRLMEDLDREVTFTGTTGTPRQPSL